MLTLPPPPFPLRVCPSWLCFFVRFAQFLPVQSVQKTTWYRCILSVLHFNRMHSIGMFAWHHKQTAPPVSAFSFFFASASFFFSSASAFLSFLLGSLALSPPVFSGLTHRASAAPGRQGNQTATQRLGLYARTKAEEMAFRNLVLFSAVFLYINIRASGSLQSNNLQSCPRNFEVFFISLKWMILRFVGFCRFG